MMLAYVRHRRSSSHVEVTARLLRGSPAVPPFGEGPSLHTPPPLLLHNEQSTVPVNIPSVRYADVFPRLSSRIREHSDLCMIVWDREFSYLDITLVLQIQRLDEGLVIV